MARKSPPREIVTPDTASDIRRIRAANAQRDIEEAMILEAIQQERAQPVSEQAETDYPEGAWLVAYDSDLPYELQADDEADAELRQGEQHMEDRTMANALGRLVAEAADYRLAQKIERRRTCPHVVTRKESEGLVCNRCDAIIDRSPR